MEIGKEPTMTLENTETATPTLKPGPGGKRKGAGRPKGSTTVDPLLRRVPVQVRLPKFMADWLKDKPVPAGRNIEMALKQWGLTLTKSKGE